MTSLAQDEYVCFGGPDRQSFGRSRSRRGRTWNRARRAVLVLLKRRAMKFGVQTKKRVDSSLPQSELTVEERKKPCGRLDPIFSDPLASCIFSYHLRCHAHKQSAQATKNKPSAHHRHLRHHHVHHRTTHQTNRHTVRMLMTKGKGGREARSCQVSLGTRVMSFLVGHAISCHSMSCQVSSCQVEHVMPAQSKHKSYVW